MDLTAADQVGNTRLTEHHPNWPRVRTGVNCKKLDNKVVIFTNILFLSPRAKNLYQEEGHQHLLLFVGVPAAGFLWLLFGVEKGDW